MNYFFSNGHEGTFSRSNQGAVFQKERSFYVKKDVTKERSFYVKKDVTKERSFYVKKRMSPKNDPFM